MKHISVKKYLKDIIKTNDKHIRELFLVSQNSSEEALRIFKETNNLHLDHLNNTYAAVKEIAEKNISTDEFNGFKYMVNKRLDDLEAVHLKQEGEYKVTEMQGAKNNKWMYFIIAAITAFISSLLTALFIFNLNK